MPTRNLARRLERLEVEFTPSDDEPVLTIIVTTPGEPNEIIELRGIEPPDRRRQPWPPQRGFKDAR